MPSFLGNPLAIWLLCAGMVAMAPGQAGDTPAPASTSDLLFENDYFRVLRVPVQAGEVPIQGKQSRDVVIVAVVRPAVPNASAPEAPVNFVPKGSPPHLTPSTIPYDAVVIELKKHWEAEIHPCASPMTCTHKITAGGLEVGETTFLFGNGFVTAYRHHLVPGGTLDSSYHSSKGTNRILVVALTDLSLNLGGVEQNLHSGQVFFSDQTEVEVNAGSHDAAWVVVRVLNPQ